MSKLLHVVCQTVIIKLRPFCVLTENCHNGHLRCYCTKKKKFIVKKYIRDYWYVIVPLYFGNVFLWFAGCHYLTNRGFDITKLLKKLNFSQEIIDQLKSSDMGKAAMTLTLFKILTPLRVATFLFSSSYAMKYIIRNNLLPPKPISFFKKKKE